MKTLVLLRHAKTEPQSLIKSDFNRKLIDRGHSDIRKVASKLMQTGVKPSVILCSTATRAKETLDGFLTEFEFDAPIEYLDALYHASASDILNTAMPFFEKYDTVMVIGHNFGISNLANWMSFSGAEEMPTSGIHVLQFDKSIEPYSGKILHTLTPKSI